MSEPFIGEIIMFGGNFAPRSWALCNGQLLSIAQNTALFSILGTTYGGNGQTTFALPDMRGRSPKHPGQGPGLASYTLGESAGTESTSLTINNMPTHNHLVTGSSGDADQTKLNGRVLATAGANIYANSGADATMAATAVSLTGGNQPFSILNPYLCVNFIIAIEGIFPSRN